MIPINFKEQNTNHIGKGCLDLPTYKDDEQIISCWALEDDELVDILKKIKIGERPQIYLSVKGNAQPPVWLTAVTPFTENEEKL